MATQPAGPAVSGTQNEGSTPAAAAAPRGPVTGLRLKIQTLLAGVQAAIPANGQVMVAGTWVSKADLIADLQAELAYFTAVETHESALKQARQQREARLPAMQAAYLQITDGMRAGLGRGNPLLLQCGLPEPKKRQPLSPQAMLVRAEKVRQTRRLRNTLGPKQKAKLRFTGEVTLATQARPPDAATPLAATFGSTARGSTARGSTARGLPEGTPDG